KSFEVDLDTSNPRIVSGPANDELAGRIDIPPAVLRDRQPAACQSLTDIGLDHLAHLLRIPVGIEVLRGYHNLGDSGRLAVHIAHRHLALCVRPKLRGVSL